MSRATPSIAFDRVVRPREMVDLLAGRAWSTTWRMSDADLAAAVDAMRGELLEEYGDLDREVAVETGFWVRAYRPPEA